LNSKAKLLAVHHILVSSAETIGAFNTGFDTANLHRPTTALIIAGLMRSSH
jgi:hypothetical protein